MRGVIFDFELGYIDELEKKVACVVIIVVMRKYQFSIIKFRVNSSMIYLLNIGLNIPITKYHNI